MGLFVAGWSEAIKGARCAVERIVLPIRARVECWGQVRGWRRR